MAHLHLQEIHLQGIHRLGFQEIEHQGPLRAAADGLLPVVRPT